MIIMIGINKQKQGLVDCVQKLHAQPRLIKIIQIKRTILIYN